MCRPTLLSSGYRCCLATLVLIFLLVYNCPSSLTSSQPSVFPLPRDMANPSKCVIVDYLTSVCKSSFLFLSHLVTPSIILISFMSAVVICCSSLFVKVQHSLPKIGIGISCAVNLCVHTRCFARFSLLRNSPRSFATAFSNGNVICPVREML